jgi:hypothetical protein
MFDCDLCYDEGIRGSSHSCFVMCRCGIGATCAACDRQAEFLVVSEPLEENGPFSRFVWKVPFCQECRDEYSADGVTSYLIMPSCCDSKRD